MPKTGAKTSATAVILGDLAPLATSWELHLNAAGLSPRTVQSYLESARQFLAFLTDRGMPTDAVAIHREYAEAFIVEVLARHKPATAGVRYRSLQQFFRWLVDEGEITASPMANMRPPKVVAQPVAVFSDDQLRSILATCDPKSFDGRRDDAILRVFIDTGARLAEVTGLTVADVNLRDGVVTVVGKGGSERVLPLGTNTVKALDRYLRLRARHRQAGTPWLWIGAKGKGVLTTSGVTQMVKRRGAAAGLEHIHPHQLRHTFAHRWLNDGGSENGLMSVAGWRSREMLARYGASAQHERARAEHKRLALGDRL